MATQQSTTGSSSLQLARTPDSQVSMSEWAVIRDQATMLVTTGFLPKDVNTPEKAMAIILTGRELGIGPMAALNNINVIQGKPTVSPQLMLALINRTGEVETLAISSGKAGATCTIKRRNQVAYTAKFGPDEAAAMGLAGKDNYRKQPATMYKWRAVADACRSTFADALLGLYTPDELGATVDGETGEAIEVTPEPPAPKAIAPVERPIEQLASELVAHVTRDNGEYEVADPSDGEVFTISKGAGGSDCSCGSTGMPLCRHRLAVVYWAKAQKAQPPPPKLDINDFPSLAEAIVTAAFTPKEDAPEFDSEAHQAAFDAQMPPIEAAPFGEADWLYGKAQRISIFGFCAALEKRGILEDEWRAQMHQLVGVSSRKELTRETAAKVEFAFANWVDSLDAHAQPAKKKGVK